MAIFKLTVPQVLLSQRILNVFHIGTEASGTLVQAQETAEAMIEHVYGEVLPLILCNEWSFPGAYSLTDVSSPGNPTIPFSMAPAVGLAVLDPLPTQVAGLVTWRSYTARPNRAHKFFSGLTTGAMTSLGRFTGDVTDALEEIGNTIINSQPLAGLLPFVTVRYYPNSSEVHMANQLTHVHVTDVPTDRSTRKLGRGN